MIKSFTIPIAGMTGLKKVPILQVKRTLTLIDLLQQHCTGTSQFCLSPCLASCLITDVDRESLIIDHVYSQFPPWRLEGAPILISKKKSHGNEVANTARPVMSEMVLGDYHCEQ